MAATVSPIAETLPTEILESIFSYSTYEDVVKSIQNVCSRWRQVAQSSRVWKHLEYCPNRDTSCKEIAEMLKISPKLQNLVLKKECDDSVLQAITNNCAELKKLQMIRQQCFDLNFIKDLQEECPKIEYLSIGGTVLENYEVCKVVGKFTNLKVLIVTGLVCTLDSISLRPLAEHCKKLEHFEFRSIMFEVDDLRHLLLMRKETLHTLGVYCCSVSSECVLPVVSLCKIKSLSLFAYWRCERYDKKIKYFGQLKTLRALSIEDFPYEELDRIKKIFENGNMSQLRKLSLYNSTYFDDNVTNVILNNCPMLQTISLERCRSMTDVGFKTLSKFKELSSLTISSNDIINAGFLHLQDVRHLKSLRIANCRKLSKQGFEAIATLSKLRELKLWKQDLAGFPWNVIPCQMKYLGCLCISACKNVDMCAIEKLKRQLPALSVYYQETERTDFRTDFRWDHLY